MTLIQRSNQGRLGSRKSSTGCTTCKIRKVKCDESRPVCNRCKSTGRKCDGYAEDVNIAQSVVLRFSPGTHDSASLDAIRSFQFFTERVVPNLSHIVNKVFWCDTIPRLGRADAIVWDAVVAFSHLLQRPPYAYVYDSSMVPMDDKPPVNTPDHVRALKWYNKSISTLRERLTYGQVSSIVARVSCILYICIECLQNNIRGALTLHQQAMALAQAAKDQSSLECDFDLEETLGTLLQHMSVVQNLPMLERKDDRFTSQGTTSILWQAREELYLLIRDAHAFCCSIEEIKLTQGKDWMASPAQKRRSKDIHTKFTMWISNLNKIPGFSLSFLNEHESEVYSVLLLAYSHCSIWLSACLSTYEIAYDSFFPTFKVMVEHARRAISVSKSESRPVFVFEARIIPTMFFVATRCRHPSIRREAIKVLREGPQIENMWRADSMAHVAELNVAIEESGNVHAVFIPKPQNVDLPSEHNRIFRQKAVESLDEFGKPAHYLHFARWEQDTDMKWVQKEGVVRIGP